MARRPLRLLLTVAVVGLGGMGSRISRRLLEAGNEVVVWNRSPERAQPLVTAGAVDATTPADAARRAEVVITMVSDPAALVAVTEGPDGICAGAGASTLAIEMSTVGPAAVARLRAALPDGAALVDAPVLGSIAEAEAGTLAIVAGGAPADVERALPLLEQLGTPAHVGPLGSGAAAKLVANAALLGSVALLGETLALAERLGLARATAYDVLGKTPLADQAERRRAAIDAGDYPPRFPLALARKDAELVAENAGGELPLLDAVRARLADAERAGLGGRDYTALLARILGPLVAVALAAGCGGAARLSHDAYQRVLAREVTRLDARILAAGNDAKTATSVQHAVDAAATRLAKLHPPRDAADANADLVRALRAYALELGDFAVAAASLSAGELRESQSRLARSPAVLDLQRAEAKLRDAGYSLTP